ncbi:MAG: M20/M25/M40 family metallo-hydrolase [Clostridia bacterium]|nr:M20/M25/M40 family metallo-hydrolase [Clostridia bacterium]
MSSYEKIFERIDELSSEYVSHWVNFASIESPTDYKEGVDDASEYIIGIAEKFGWKIEKQRFEKSGDAVCITMNPDAKGAPVALSGHVDTVHPVGLFGNPPVRIGDGKIYGPGVNDCKGGIVAGMLAMAALEKEGFKGRPVMMLLQTDEETSSAGSEKGTVRFMCGKARNAVAFLNLEGYSRGKATLIRKGISKYRLYVHGKAVHAANCIKGVNAITEAAYKIIELEKLKEPFGITGNCGIITGGTAINSVPAECEFTLDIRFNNTEEMEKADKIVREVAAHSYIEGTSCDVELVSRRYAMELCDRNLSLLCRMNEIFRESGLPELEINKSKGGSDAADVTLAGIPCVDSLGTDGTGIHSSRECSNLSSLPESAKRIAAVVFGL